MARWTNKFWCLKNHRSTIMIHSVSFYDPGQHDAMTLLVDFCFSYVFMLLWLICKDPSQTWSKHLVVINFLRHAKLQRICQSGPVEACLHRSQFSSNLTVIQRNGWIREDFGSRHRATFLAHVGFQISYFSASCLLFLRQLHTASCDMDADDALRVSVLEGFQVLQGFKCWRVSIIEGIELLTESNCRGSNFEGFQPLKGFNWASVSWAIPNQSGHMGFAPSFQARDLVFRLRPVAARGTLIDKIRWNEIRWDQIRLE